MSLLDELVRHLYVDLGQSTGGPLHIVLDDGNVDGRWLAEDDGSRYAFLFDGRFEDYAQAGENVSLAHRREIRDTCELILAELRRMSVAERHEAVTAAYNAASAAIPGPSCADPIPCPPWEDIRVKIVEAP